MPITNYSDLRSAQRVRVFFDKTGTRSATAARWNTTFDLAGNAGTLSQVLNSTGVVPVSTDTGYPRLPLFGSGRHGFLTGARAGASRVSSLALYDRLYVNRVAGVASRTITPPSFAARLPLLPDLSEDFSSTQLWIEVVTTHTSAVTYTIGYTNNSNQTGRTTSVTMPENALVGTLFRAPLQGGDTGISAVTSLTSDNASGSVNVNVMRPLWLGDNSATGFATKTKDVFGAALDLGMSRVFDTSALVLLTRQTSTATTQPVFADFQISVG